jgi:hypothetical protein
MRASRNLWSLLPIVLFVVCLVVERRALAAACVAWSRFEERGGVYVPPGSTLEQRAQWAADLDLARRRVRKLYGVLRGQPKLVFSDEASLAGFIDNSTAATHYLPNGAVTVVGPRGQNVDVLAHELAHAELFARLGYWTMRGCVPVWFDEGLAVQFDARPFYGREALTARVREGWAPPKLRTLRSRSQFFDGGRDVARLHYAWARAAVADWLDGHSRAAAVEAIGTIGCMRSDLLDEIERASDAVALRLR